MNVGYVIREGKEGGPAVATWVPFSLAHLGDRLLRMEQEEFQCGQCKQKYNQIIQTIIAGSSGS